MDLRPDMMRDKTDDALAIGGRQHRACVAQPIGQPVNPEPPVRVQHHLDDARILEPGGDARPKGRAQHACAAGRRLGFERA